VPQPEAMVPLYPTAYVGTLNPAKADSMTENKISKLRNLFFNKITS
jgi:hypothetical protein